MNKWINTELGDIAEIRVSNVDKKTYPNQTRVRLCNYLDVYSNEIISNDLPFMIASASPAEIERFGLLAGDVVITKDSETPEDIAIPAYVDENIKGPLVCGYHLAILRPKKDKIDGLYLSQVLRLPETNKHFARFATGSTRFGLTLSAIRSAPLRIPSSIEEQQRIAKILLAMSKKIENIKIEYEKLSIQKRGLMQDLLTGEVRVAESNLEAAQ